MPIWKRKLHLRTDPKRDPAWRGHLSRHERQRCARAETFSRLTPPTVPHVVSVKIGQDELELIDRLVRHDRAAVSSALLTVAGIGAAQAVRTALLALVAEAARKAEAEEAISARPSGQIARHVRRALERCDVAVAVVIRSGLPAPDAGVADWDVRQCGR
jgi:hypothetical protein